jgi:hypothetical protein
VVFGELRTGSDGSPPEPRPPRMSVRCGSDIAVRATRATSSPDGALRADLRPAVAPSGPGGETLRRQLRRSHGPPWRLRGAAGDGAGNVAPWSPSSGAPRRRMSPRSPGCTSRSPRRLWAGSPPSAACPTRPTSSAGTCPGSRRRTGPCSSPLADGAVVGFVDTALQRHEDQGTYHAPGVDAYVEELVVTARHRRRGAGYQLGDAVWPGGVRRRWR